MQSIRAVAAGGATLAALLQPDIRMHVASSLGELLQLTDPETAHKAGLQLAKLGLVPQDTRPDDPRLRVRVWGRVFTNPLGVAAGFDKDAEVMEQIMGMGLGFMEVGAPPPQPLSPRRPAPVGVGRAPSRGARCGGRDPAQRTDRSCTLPARCACGA